MIKGKARFDSQKKLSKVKVTGQAHGGQTTITKLLCLSCYLNNSKGYRPILMSFGRIVCNDKRKANFNSQKEKWSKVKVTGVK